MNSKKRRGSLSGINMTPFMDVILVLLIIFMLSAMEKIAHLRVMLPQSQSGNADSNNGIDVVVQKNGKVLLNGKEIDKGGVASAMNGISKDSNIKISGDGASYYDMVISVIGEFVAAGFTKINLVVIKK